MMPTTAATGLAVGALVRLCAVAVTPFAFRRASASFGLLWRAGLLVLLPALASIPAQQQPQEWPSPPPPSENPLLVPQAPSAIPYGQAVTLAPPEEEDDDKEDDEWGPPSPIPPVFGSPPLYPSPPPPLPASPPPPPPPPSSPPAALAIVRPFATHDASKLIGVRSMGGGGSLRCGRRWVCARPAAGALLLEEHPRAPRHAGLAVPRGVPPGRLVQAVEALLRLRVSGRRKPDRGAGPLHARHGGL